MATGLVLGVLVAIGRTYGGRAADVVLGFYVDTMRAIPVLVVLVWCYFALPLLTGHTVTPFVAAVGALGIHLAAYVAETVRAGLTSVRPGQMRAALALGMSRGQAIRRIILPQAMIRMLPPLGSLLVIAIKDSAISSVIAVPELIRQTQVLVSNTYLSFQLYTFTMIVFFLISYPIARLTDRLYGRVAHLGAS
jgi:polar amino acid transport system permease protein